MHYYSLSAVRLVRYARHIGIFIWFTDAIVITFSEASLLCCFPSSILYYITNTIEGIFYNDAGAMWVISKRMISTECCRSEFNTQPLTWVCASDALLPSSLNRATSMDTQAHSTANTTKNEKPWKLWFWLWKNITNITRAGTVPKRVRKRDSNEGCIVLDVKANRSHAPPQRSRREGLSGLSEAATHRTGFISMLGQRDLRLTLALAAAVELVARHERWPGNERGKILTSV